MGGSLLKDCTRRQSAQEYFQKVEELGKEFAWTDLKFESMMPTQAVRDKESFGDLDLVYSTPDNLPFSVTELEKEFHPTKIIKNGEVISFDYKQMQVDLIHAHREWFKYAYNYHKFNLGNFVGKLTRYYGLSHGHKGLRLPLRDDSNMFDSVLVTLDHDKALEFVGLDPKVFHKGFDTMEDVFKFVASSPVYSPEWYKLENISSIGRMRDKKRDSYRKFLEFGERQNGTYPEKVKDKTVFFQKIFDFFPGTEERFIRSMEHQAFNKLVSEKFNGNLVKELTGLVDKELGMFMQTLRKDYRFSSGMISYTKDEIICKNIMELFKSRL